MQSILIIADQSSGFLKIYCRISIPTLHEWGLKELNIKMLERHIWKDLEVGGKKASLENWGSFRFTGTCWHIVSTSTDVTKMCIVVLIKITAFMTKVMLTANAALVWSVAVERDIQYYFPFGQCRRVLLAKCGKRLLFPVVLLWKINVHHISYISWV